MIVTFHIIYNMFLNPEKKIDVNENNLSDTNGKDDDIKIFFDPPVFLQRYMIVQNVLLETKWNERILSVVDFGCAELGFFMFLKKILSLRLVFCVDIDSDLLEQHSYKVKPMTSEYISSGRTKSFSAALINGSISDPDYRIIGVDAVIGIEIIEHLYPNTLDAIPYNIFGIIQPYLVIFTTPNADFNILFPNFKKFRHHDHKFEWTREQFQDWSQNIVSRFPDYWVKFYDIGPGPPGSENLGCCSQMAVFELQYDKSLNKILNSLTKNCTCQNNEKDFKTCNCDIDLNSYGLCTYKRFTKDIFKNISKNEHDDLICGPVKFKKCDYYNILEVIHYPFTIDTRCQEKKILDECSYRIRTWGGNYGNFFKDETNRSEIPLSSLSEFDNMVVPVTKLRKILEDAGWHIENCDFYGKISPCVIYNIMEECSNSLKDSESESDETSNFNSSSNSPRLLEDDKNLSDWESGFYNDDEYNIKNESVQCTVEPEKQQQLKLSSAETEAAGSESFNKSCDADDENEDEVENDLKCLSKEVLFDPNSVVSLLNDETEAMSQDDNDSMRTVIENQDMQIATTQTAVPFPRWLIDILSNDDEDDNNMDLLQEPEQPHFLCQGDGLGVHPIGEEIDDDDSSDTDTLSQNSMDETEAQTDGNDEPSVLLRAVIMIDGTSSVTVAPTVNESNLEVVGRNFITNNETSNSNSLPLNVTMSSPNESHDEFFDTIETNSNSHINTVSNLLTNEFSTIGDAEEALVYSTPNSSFNTPINDS